MQIFVEEDRDDDGYLSNDDVKALVPRLNAMLVPPAGNAIDPAEISDTFDGRVSISDFLDFLFHKQVLNSPLFSPEINADATGLSFYELSKFGSGDRGHSTTDPDYASFKDVLHEYVV